MPYALCPMPYALCPMPYAGSVPHLSEKDYKASPRLYLGLKFVKVPLIEREIG